MSGATTAESSEQSGSGDSQPASECEQSRYDCLTQPLSRRKLLKGTAATAGAAALASTASSEVATASVVGAGTCEIGAGNEEALDPSPNGGAVSPGNFERAGHPNRDAYRSLAETERRFSGVLAQNSTTGQGRPAPEFQRTVNAVDDLGADPNGNEPANEALEQGAEDGTLIVLPKGSKFLLDGDLNFGAEGTFGMVGEGYKEVSKPPGKNGARFVAASGTQARITTGAVTSGLFANFVLDQSASKAGIAILPEAENFCYLRDVRLVGVQDNVGSAAKDRENNPSCALIAHSENAVVRVQRFYAANHNLPGEKNTGAVPTFWVGRENQGTAEIVQCQSTAGSNGIYGSRTPGDVHIIDGAYINNAVSQIRFAGKGSWGNGCTLMVDVDQYKGPNPSEFNQKIGTNGVKTEMPSHIRKPGGARLKNVEVIGRSARNIGSLVFVRGHAGALTMENCRIVNQLEDVPSLTASVPGSSYDPKTKPPYDVSIKKSTFTGLFSSPVINIQGRPASSIADTCLKMEGAGPDSIQGQVSLQNVTYGPECKGTGASGAVGSAVDAVEGAYNGAVNFVSDVASGLFKGAAVIATLPVIVLIAVAILAIVFSSSLLAALAFMGGAVKFFSKKDD